MSQGRRSNRFENIIIAFLVIVFVILVILGRFTEYPFIFYPTALFPIFVASYRPKKAYELLITLVLGLIVLSLFIQKKSLNINDFIALSAYIILSFVSIGVIRNQFIVKEQIEDDYASMFDHIPLGVVVLETIGGGNNFRFVGINKATEKYREVDKNAIIGKTFTEVFEGYQIGESLEWFKKVYETGEFQDIPPLKIRDSDPVIWIKSYAYKLKSGNIVVLFSDVTEWQKTNSELQDKRQFYETLFNNNLSVMLIVDPDSGSIMDVNNAAAEFYGYDRETLLTLNIADLSVLPKPKVLSEIRKALKHPEDFAQYTHKLASGEIREVEMYSGPIHRQGRDLLFSLIHDISNRKKAESDLLEARERYKQLAENIPDIVFTLDKNLRCIYWNKACEQLTHRKASEAIGKPVTEIYPFKNKVNILNLTDELTTNPKSSTYIETMTIDNENLSFEISVFPTGKGFLFLIRDMTDKIKLTSELLEVNRYLEAIGKCNEAIVYASDERELLNEVCRSLIEYGMYRFIWIGLYEAKAATPFRIVAEAGRKQSNLHRQSPVTIDIRNPYCIVNQVIAQKIPLQFKINESFYDKGFHCGLDLSVNAKSAICIPLLFQNELIGIITLYSVKEDSFLEEESRYLTDLSGNIAHAIVGFRARESKRIAEAELFVRLLYEEGLAKFSQALLSEEPDAIVKSLYNLLEVSKAGRVYIFENFSDDEGKLCMKYIYEVVSAGVKPALGTPGFERVPYELFPRWEKKLSQGNSISGVIAEFPDSERQYLEPQGIQSVLMLPVFIGLNWFGYIGFDDTREPRIWSDNDIRLLRTASEIIGLYLGRKKSEQKIREYQTQLRNLASELSIAEERERKQLATQLHDTIVQNLAISKINMGMLKSEISDEDTQSKLERIVTLIDLSIKQSRNLMNELSPPMLFDLGIAEAIEGLIDDLYTRFGLEAVLECPHKFLKLPQNMTILLYQSVRELLMNVIKHAGNKSATVKINRVPEGLDVRVADTGKGFDPARALTAPGIDKGFGLFSVKERLSYIDGDLQVDSVPDKGTTIRLFIPVTDEQIEEPGGNA